MTAPGQESPGGEIEPGPVLVTGASGFVGAAIADAFSRAGFPVTVLARASSPRTNLAELDARVVEGDIRDRAAVARALRGQRYLVHAAADYRLWIPDPDVMRAINVEGTRVLMEEAIRAGLQRVVYTSSVATLKLDPAGQPVDESRPNDEATTIGVYKQSKVAAERVVERLVRDEGLPAVIVNPSTPIGPRDVRPTPTGRIIVEAASGRMPAFVDTGLNLAHVDDVAAGHLLALRRGRLGERYILGGENVTLAAMLAGIAGLVGRRAPKVRLPRAPLYPLAVGAELFGRVTGRTPFVTRDALAMARYRMFFDDAKARRELGYTSRPSLAGISDAISWFRRAGYVR